MEIPREFYKLSELAQKKWILTKDEILHIAAAGEIRLSVYWSGGYWFGDKTENQPLNQYVFIPSRHARELLADCYLEIDGGIEVCDVTTIDGKEISLVRTPSRNLDENYVDIKNDDIKNRSNTVIPPTFSREKILVMLNEVKRYENLHPDVINREGLSELWRKRPTFQQMTKGKVTDREVTNQPNQTNMINAGSEHIHPNQQETEKPPLRCPPGHEFLRGRQKIQKYLKVKSWETAQRWANLGNWLRKDALGKPITTTFEIDEWRINSGK
jgi:hypothetical protein